jgi:hypothetical protein
MVGIAFGDEAHLLYDKSYRAPVGPVNYTARASTEAIWDALALADSKMNLSAPSTDPRLVVVISDGAWVDPEQRAKGDMYLRKLMNAGCRVLFVGVGHARWCSVCGDQTCELSDSYPADSASDLDHPAHKKVILSKDSDIKTVIGDALVDVLRQ